MNTPNEPTVRDRIKDLENQILGLTGELYRLKKDNEPPFTPGKTTVPYAGRVYDENEVKAAVKSSLDFWLTLGPEGIRMESELKKFLGAHAAILVNSGSSANLVAFQALTSSKLERPFKPGDEMITVAAAFPTTVNPCLQAGGIPVFVDMDLKTINIDVSRLEDALSEKTRVVMIAHTLGNPFDLGAVTEFCKRHDLWLIEDNCDALGSRYNGQLTGTFGHMGTSSFYPPHHITMGEGGAVYIGQTEHAEVLETIANSLRDWGRDCWCASGRDNTCGKRFAWEWEKLPYGYDHKYVYSHIGYNLKPIDIQAAIGREQLKKLPSFVEARKRNWQRLRDLLADLENEWHFVEATPNSEPAWFGFFMVMRTPDHDKLTMLCRALDTRKIGNRRLFAGNLLWQPAYKDMKHRVVGSLPVTEMITRGGIFLGVYPGLTGAMIESMASAVIDEWKTILD